MRRRYLKYLLIVLIWTLVAVVTASQVFLEFRTLGQGQSWFVVFAFQAVVWGPWVLYTGLILKVDALLAYRVRRTQWIWAHGALCLLLILINTAFLAMLTMMMEQVPFRADTVMLASRTILMGYLVQFLVSYGAVVGVSYAWRLNEAVKQRELQAAQMQTRLVVAQLQALKMQLHPHFLFNTLNSIAVLIRRHDYTRADQMLSRLGDLLRYTLDTAQAQTVALHQELDILQRYLALEQVRFQDRLAIQTEVAPEALQAHVPTLMLQPLVENALRHGIAKTVEEGTITITAARRQEHLVLEVIDTGPGMPEAAAPGVGLTNTQARLTQLYGEAQSFSITPVLTGGTRVEIRLPYSLHPYPEPLAA